MPVTARLAKLFYDRLGEQVANELVEWFNAVAVRRVGHAAHSRHRHVGAEVAGRFHTRVSRCWSSPPGLSESLCTSHILGRRRELWLGTDRYRQG